MKKLMFCLLVAVALVVLLTVTITLASTALHRSDDTIERIDRKIEMYERGR